VPEREVILAPATTTFSVALEPAFNAIASLRLLMLCEEMIGLSPWVAQTRAAMTSEQLDRHELIFNGLYYAVEPDRSFASFPAYISFVENTPPERLRDRMLSSYLLLAIEMGNYTPDTLPAKEALIADRDLYLDFVSHAFTAVNLNSAIEMEAHALLNNLPRMRGVIVDYLREMWEQFLAAEWLRTRPMVQESLDAFRQVDLTGMSKAEAVQVVTDRVLTDKLAEMVDQYARIVFVPSPHLGAYLALFYGPDTLWMAFGARLPAGQVNAASALSRAELVVRLGALADDIRLRILALIAERGELCAQDIITALDLSQSAASRHLTQLSATGYLLERKQENAKCYSLNQKRVSDTLAALRHFLKMT
jgi:DNA-binding transcriptional ArsR family regulator